MVRRGLVANRSRAQDEIDAGRVLVAGAVADRAARLVAPGEPLHLTGPGCRFVGRGGEKLDAAITEFNLDVTGVDALDVGASTGGFTDCLLQRGASRVVAVDVGHGLAHPRVRSDPRVVLIERTNIRDFGPVDLDARGVAPVALLVADLSFISLRTVAPALLGLTAQDADLVLLVKPQFEAGRQAVSRGRGVIRDPDVRSQAIDDVEASFLALGATMMGRMTSPITGAKGNVEFLVHLRAPGA